MIDYFFASLASSAVSWFWLAAGVRDGRISRGVREEDNPYRALAQPRPARRRLSGGEC